MESRQPQEPEHLTLKQATLDLAKMSWMLGARYDMEVLIFESTVKEWRYVDEETRKTICGASAGFPLAVYSPRCRLLDFEQVPLPYQHRVLSWGILGAVVMRALFIAAGEAAMSVFHPVLLGFAGVLLFSAYKLWTEDEDESEDLTENAIVAFASKSLSGVDFYDGDNFFTMVSVRVDRLELRINSEC